VEHLSRLVDDLLDVARVARGKIELQRAPLEVARVVSQAVEMASPLLEQRAHQLTLKVPRTGLVVDGDAVRLAQVLGNLVTNAAKYTPPEGRIEIAAGRQGAEVVITVSDSGPGIDEALLPRVFDLFVQGPQKIDRAAGGLGLGLAVVKNLVLLHGGTVTARNRAGGGSELTVRLPAAADGVVAARGPATPPRGVPAVSSARQRILVVDDNEDAAELLSELLRSVGHEVVVAYDGPQALEALRRFHADVALLDLGLPGMDGFELARRIRARRNGSVRLIAVTGYGQEHDRAGTRSAGFDVHLTKPVPVADHMRILNVS
jgi:CheY-like chemotaxis protein